MLPDKTSTWRDWHLPISFGNYTLKQVLDSSAHMKAQQEDIPLMVKLVENPKFDLPGFDIFHGAVNLHDHDCIHALLGRGMLSKDEAFTIGFTMGSTNRVTSAEQKLYEWAAKYLYPGPYKFDDEAIQVFKDGVHLGYVSDCQPLDQIDFNSYMDITLDSIRQRLGLETDLLLAYYNIEARRYPQDKASQRLLKKK